MPWSVLYFVAVTIFVLANMAVALFRLRERRRSLLLFFGIGYPLAALLTLAWVKLDGGTVGVLLLALVISASAVVMLGNVGPIPRLMYELTCATPFGGGWHERRGFRWFRLCMGGSAAVFGALLLVLGILAIAESL